MKNIVLFALFVLMLSSCNQFKELVQKLPRYEEKNQQNISATNNNNSKEIYSGEVMGVMEKILISDDIGSPLVAKLDDTTEITVLDVDIINEFEKEDKEFVTFKVTSGSLNERTFTKEVVRRGAVDKSSRRPIVMMEICLGNRIIEAEFNLADDEHLLYPVIIGNNILKDRIIVDKSKEYSSAPACQ